MPPSSCRASATQETDCMEPFERVDVDTSHEHPALKRTRPSWDEYFMRIAHEVATRSTCPRLAVGAVIVRDKRILHAEQNAIIQAAYHGVSVTGASIYCTHQPCLLCVKMIMNAGIEEVRYAAGYPDPLALELAAGGGLRMVRFTAGEGET